MTVVERREVALVDLLDRLLAGGVVITGDITLRIADVDLVRIDLNALISSVNEQVPSPRSRNQRPPGKGSSVSGMATPWYPWLPGPSSSSRAAKVTSSEARTWMSWVMLMERFSRPGASAVVMVISSSSWCCRPVSPPAPRAP
jgi:hypothetical protein